MASHRRNKHTVWPHLYSSDTFKNPSTPIISPCSSGVGSQALALLSPKYTAMPPNLMDEPCCAVFRSGTGRIEYEHRGYNVSQSCAPMGAADCSVHCNAGDRTSTSEPLGVSERQQPEPLGVPERNYSQGRQGREPIRRQRMTTPSPFLTNLHRTISEGNASAMDVDDQESPALRELRSPLRAASVFPRSAELPEHPVGCLSFAAAVAQEDAKTIFADEDWEENEDWMHPMGLKSIKRQLHTSPADAYSPKNECQRSPSCRETEEPPTKAFKAWEPTDP